MFDHEKKQSYDLITPTFASRFVKGSLSFAMLIAGLSFTAVSARSEIRAVFAPSTTAVAVQRARRYGPYATLRRANEVANYARRYGYKAKVIYGGSLYSDTRRYYVDVWQ
jgi:hypothetical protein